MQITQMLMDRMASIRTYLTENARPGGRIGVLLLLMMTGLSAAADPWKAAAESLTAGNAREAVEAYSKLIREHPGDARGYLGRGRACRLVNDDEGAMADFDMAIELNPKLDTAYTNRGTLMMRMGYYDRAIADYAKVIALNDRNAMAYYNRASAYDCNGQDDKALADYHKAVELAPDIARIYNNLGFLLETRGEHDQAIANYTKAIELLPTFAMYYNGRGDALLNKGDYGKAMADVDKAIELDPKSNKAYRVRAGAWLVQGEFEKAIADSTRSIELNPQMAKSYRIRSAAREALGDGQGAQEDARKALILGPQPPFGMAVVVSPQIMAREELALKELLDKDLPETRVKLAAVRHDHALAILDNPRAEPSQQALEEAVAYVKSATMLEPDHAGHWFLTGLLFRKLAEHDERAAAMAEQALRQAVEVDPQHAASWLELGLMMAAQERGRDAMTALENALASDPARTASKATGLLCAMYALNDEGFRGIDFFQELYASQPEISALGIGAAVMLDYLGDREAAIEQARDILLVEKSGTPDYAYAAKLLREWKEEKP